MQLLITPENLAGIRRNNAARSELDIAVRNASAEMSLALGRYVMEKNSATSDAAYDNLVMSGAAFRVLKRLEKTVAQKGSKPIDKEAVAWAVERIEAAAETKYTALRDAIQLDHIKPRLNEALHARLVEEMSRPDKFLDRAEQTTALFCG